LRNICRSETNHRECDNKQYYKPLFHNTSELVFYDYKRIAIFFGNDDVSINEKITPKKRFRQTLLFCTSAN
jgi:hypothetical protein